MPEFPKLNGVEREALRLLSQKREMYGLEMVKASDKIKRTTVYVVLMRLVDKGWITSRPEDNPAHSGMARQLYSITAPGVRALQAADAVEAVLTAMPQGV